MRLRAGPDEAPLGRPAGRHMPARRAAGAVAAGAFALILGLHASPGFAADEPADSHAAHHPAAGMAPGMPADAPSMAPPGAPAGMAAMMDMMKPVGSPPAAGMPNAPAPATAPGAMPMPPATAASAPMAVPGAGGGMAGMGAGCCGGAGPKPFYAALMAMPSLTPEARQFIQAEADRRLGDGTERITTGQMQLHHALAASDQAAAQQGAASVRQGLLLVESGDSALQALAEGQPPRQIALAWFKGQANIPLPAGMDMGDGPWGLSWVHLTTMALLAASLAAALALHFARMRRAAVLVERLSGAAPAATASPPGMAPAPPGLAPAPPAPPASPPAALAAAPGPAPPGARSKQWAGLLRVAAIFQETATVKTFRLMDPGGGAIPFTFLPGQFLTFAAEIDGKPIRRSYTIASSPTQRDHVELTVKREDLGIESRYLHDHVAVGDLLQLAGPSGAFTFTGAEASGIVLIAGGVGITPMMCIIRYLADRSYPGDIFFLYGARTTEDFIFREELEHLQKRHANLHVAATMSRAEGATWMGAEGPVSQGFIARAVPGIAARRVHLCGPPAMMDAVKAALLELGVPRQQVKTEAFGPARGAAPPAAPPASPAPAPALAAATAAPSAQATVQFSKSAKSGPLAPDQSVLEAAEAIGLSIDFSCRVGTCGTCVVPLSSGAVAMEVEDGLPPDQKARGMILACQAKSVGDLVVDA